MQVGFPRWSFKSCRAKTLSECPPEFYRLELGVKEAEMIHKIDINTVRAIGYNAPPEYRARREALVNKLVELYQRSVNLVASNLGNFTDNDAKMLVERFVNEASGGNFVIVTLSDATVAELQNRASGNFVNYIVTNVLKGKSLDEVLQYLGSGRAVRKVNSLDNPNSKLANYIQNAIVPPSLISFEFPYKTEKASALIAPVTLYVVIDRREPRRRKNETPAEIEMAEERSFHDPASWFVKLYVMPIVSLVKRKLARENAYLYQLFPRVQLIAQYSFAEALGLVVPRRRSRGRRSLLLVPKGYTSSGKEEQVGEEFSFSF